MNKPMEDSERSVGEIFVDCARQYPDHTAVIHGGDEWTYHQLDRCSSELAYILVNQYGAKPESRFAIIISKSVYFIVALLAMFKSGAAYVPIDPEYPDDRIRFILDDCDASLILTTLANYDRFTTELSLPYFQIDSVVNKQPQTTTAPFFIQSTDLRALAYILYTSGTTGRPKGVLIQQGGVANVATEPHLREAYGPGNRVIQFMSVSFDGILIDTLRTLCAGGTVIIPTLDIIGDLRTVHAGLLMPSFISRLDPHDFPQFRVVFAGGEFFPPELQTRWASHCTLVNIYGPTETTIYSHLTVIHPEDHVSIGRPIRNTFSLVVDEQLQLVPVGVTGELLIGGVGIARGYQNLPELTAAKFIPNPHGPGRVFRTGDHVRWLSDGRIEFIGRMDNLVKLRGYRIELEEIESVANRFPGLNHCVAAVVHDTLVIFVSPVNVDSNALLEYMSNRLARQMVPELVVPVKDFKTAPSGKLDRKALPSVDHLLHPGPSPSLNNTQTLTLKSEAEQVLGRAWAQLLQVDINQICASDHFFRVGGDSISAILLVSKCQQLGYHLTVPLVYQYPELHKMADHTAKISKAKDSVTIAYQTQVHGEVNLTPIQHWFLGLPLHNHHHFNQSFMLKVNSQSNVTQSSLTGALVALINHHDTLRVRFQLDGSKRVWTQEISATNAVSTDFQIVEETVGIVDYPSLILQIQSGLNLTTGPVLAAALIHDPVDSSSTRLFLTIHHALVDLVGWRILIEDLNTLLGQKELPPKTLSFQAWATQLNDYATALSADIWPQQVDPATPISNIRKLLPSPEISVSDTQIARLSVSFEFDWDFTNSLLFQLAPQWHVTPRDLLLATFTQSFATVVGLSQVTLCMEGHGREPWSPDQDITRTVGWFTALYPLVLRIQPGQSLYDLLRHTKEALQQIPGKGFPYALLKYMPSVRPEERAKLEAKTPVQLDVQFNYFGRFTNTNGDYSDGPLSIEWSDLFGLHDFAPNDHVIYDINPMPTLVGDQLRLVLEYNPRVYHRDIIAQIMNGWQRNLVELNDMARHSQSIVAEPLFTRYDFPHLQLSETEFSEILGTLNSRGISLNQVRDLLPCIAVQGGLLTGLEVNPSAYLVQMAFKLTGPLDSKRLLQAWESVANQHSPLRTVFIESSAKQSQGFVQALLHPFSTNWTTGEKPIDSLDLFFADNHKYGFTLNAHMIRNFIFPTADRLVHDIVLTIHHSLIDGWSLPLLLQQWMDTYHHPQLLAPLLLTSFDAVVSHIQTIDSTSAQEFWSDFLGNFSKTPAPLILPPGYSSLGFDALTTDLNVPKVAMTNRAQLLGVTLSTLLQATYALVLGRLIGQDDVVFGMTVSGRNLNLSGMDQVIGPLINTVPFRVRLDQPSHTILTDITRWLSISDIRIHEFTEYPLTVNFIDQPSGIQVKILEFYGNHHYNRFLNS
ncbi:hypothetical protein H4R33_003209 [Dimargaris cristalligena]|nr:hypothetical protein H4R33_003209 [Dimargaris cristalligena]